MNTPIDTNINKFHKGFIANTAAGTEDPTYLGFSFVFDFAPVGRNQETGQTDDPLFTEDANLESAIRYLKATGYPNRAVMLQKFKKLLQTINEQTPWFFQTLSGVNDLWKIEFGENFNPFRGKDKVLEITCLESVDLKITALADLYRKATFDTKYMRFLVPENLRWFTMKIRVAEMRSFHQVKEIVKTQFPNGSATIKSSVNTTANQTNANAAIAPTMPASSGLSTHADIFTPLDNLISLMEFQLGKCIFDFSESFPDDNLISMAATMDMAIQKFKIKVGYIQEANSFKILDLILKDGLTQENGVPGSALPNFDGAINKRNDNILTNTTNTLTSNLQDRLNKIASVPGNLIAGGVNQIGSAVTTVTLGNVYDKRNQALGTVVNGFLGKNDQIPTASFGDVYPNVPGTDLTQPDSGPLGNIY